VGRRLAHLCLWVVVLLGCVFGVRYLRTAGAEGAQRATIGRVLSASASVNGHFELVRPAGGPPSQIGGLVTDSPCAEAIQSPCAVAAAGSAPAKPIAAVDIGPSLQWLLNVNQGRRFVLMVLFSPTDCPLCLKEAAVWNALAIVTDKRGPLIQVIGVADRTTTEEMQYVTRDLGLQFPVYVDRDSTVRKRLGVQLTPFKVLLTAAGAVEMVDGSRQLLPDQRLFERRVLDTVRRVD
jgi:hypothetical protein